jgi:hypothetical protein
LDEDGFQNWMKMGSALDEDGHQNWMKIGWWVSRLDEDGYQDVVSLSLFHVQSMLDFRATIIKFALTAK